MTHGQGDPEREERTEREIIADCFDATERALGWHYYLQDRLQCPFTARCIARRATSPLHVGDEVEVMAMAPQEVCEHEMFVMIRWESEGLAVPLAQISPIAANAETVQAIEDWDYWARQRYRF